MQKIYPITGKIFSSPYDWGGNKLIPQTLGFEAEPGTPYAEYWIGAHKRGPSIVQIDGEEKTLEEIINEDPERVLGEEVKRTFGELPYLFKLCEAKKMLSVQVHPNKQQAIEGFAEEEKTGIPATELKRTYKDANSKTEMPVAISDFYSLYGFTSENELLARLNEIEEFRPLIPYFENGDYKKLYIHVLQEMTDQEVSMMFEPLVKRIVPLFEEGKLKKESHDYWAAKAVKDFDMHEGKFDRGLFSIYFLNLVHLKPGQSIFEAAGVLHAFLEGQYIEIMQNSDNIARIGATNKPIDIEGFLKFTIFEAQIPHVLDGDKNGNETSYPVPADEYLISKIALNDHETYKNTSTSAEIILAVKGSSTITSEETSLSLAQGKSVVVFADCSYEIESVNDSVLYRLIVPKK